MSLSKISVLHSLRINDGNNPTLITAQVLRMKFESGSYANFTLQVLDESGERVNIAMKSPASYKRHNDLAKIAEGDVITISHCYRKPRDYKAYRPSTKDVNIELQFRARSKLHSVLHPAEGVFDCFDLLTSGMNVTVVGKSIYDSEKDDGVTILSLLDIKDTVIEVRLKKNVELKVKADTKCIFKGKIAVEDGVVILLADAGRVYEDADALIELQDLTI